MPFFLALHENMSTTTHAQTFFQSIHTLFLLHRVATALSSVATSDVLEAHKYM